MCTAPQPVNGKVRTQIQVCLTGGLFRSHCNWLLLQEQQKGLVRMNSLRGHLFHVPRKPPCFQSPDSGCALHVRLCSGKHFKVGPKLEGCLSFLQAPGWLWKVAFPPTPRRAGKRPPLTPATQGMPVTSLTPRLSGFVSSF